MAALRTTLMRAILLHSNGRLAVLVSYTLESDARDTAFAVVVLREDAMMADNLVVENAVLLDYREAVSFDSGAYTAAKSDVPNRRCRSTTDLRGRHWSCPSTDDSRSSSSREPS